MAGSLGTISGQVRLDVRQAVASYAALRAQNSRTVYALRGTGDAFVASGQRMAVAGGAMVYAFAKVVNAAAEFERKMDYASAVSGATGKQMQKMSDYALQLGQDTIYSASQIADGFIELAKAGVSTEDIIGGVGKAMTDLAAAADIGLAPAGQIMTSTMQQFELGIKDLAHVTDLISGAANASIADVEDIGVSLKYVGGVAHTAGISFDETATAISILAKAGIRGSTAGTSLRQIITSLGGSTEAATSQLKDLGIITDDGTNKFFNMHGEVKPLAQVFQILQNSMDDANYTAKDSLKAFKTIFNQRALSSVSVLTRKGAKGFKDMYAEMGKTKAADVAKERLNNLSGDIEILRGNIETMTVKAGGPFQKELRGWVQGLTKLIQKFGELDPAMQENIIRLIAITGASLIALGTFNIIIGSIFRFAASMLKLAAGIKFAVSWLKNAWVWGRLLASVFLDGIVAALAAITAPVAAVIAIIALLVVGFIIAYKKIEGFRNVVNSIIGVLVSAGKAIFNWFKLLATDPSAAWEKLKGAVSSLVTSIQTQIGKIPGLISRGLDTAQKWVSNFVDSIVNWFKALPGKILTALAAFGTMVGNFFASLPGLVGYAIGFLIGFIVKQFLLLPVRILAAIIKLPALILSVFAKLAPMAGYAIGFMIGKVVGLMIRLGINMVRLTIKAVTGTINFFRTLPARVAGFVLNMVNRGISLFNTFRTRAPQIAAQLVAATINFFRTLPSRAVAFFTQLYTKGREKFNQLKTQAVQIAGQIVKGFIDGIKGLPAQASGIVSEAIAMFKAKVQEAFNAAKSFAKGLWDGFKDGLGINSPSLIEKQMWQITDVMDTETKKMAKTTMKVREISRKLGKTQFSVGDTGAPSSAQEYRRLAVMQSRNQKRSQALAGSAGNRQDRARPVVKVQRGPQAIGGSLVLENGYAYVAGVAEEIFDNFADDNSRRGN